MMKNNEEEEIQEWMNAPMGANTPEPWTSVRFAWPKVEGNYEVKDCRHKVEGTAYYDGYEWQKPEYETPSGKSSPLYIEYTITHWREIYYVQNPR